MKARPDLVLSYVTCCVCGWGNQQQPFCSVSTIIVEHGIITTIVIKLPWMTLIILSLRGCEITFGMTTFLKYSPNPHCTCTPL